MSLIPTLTCPACKHHLPASLFLQAAPETCPQCSSGLETHVFPALFAPPPAAAKAESLADASEASCFFHPAKRASVACAQCGRYVCSLCDIEFQERHLCPSCLKSGTDAKSPKKKVRDLERERVLYANVVSSLAFIGLIIYGIPALVALGVGIYGWNKPASIVRPGKSRLVFALLFALLVVLLWGGGIGFLIYSLVTKSRF